MLTKIEKPNLCFCLLSNGRQFLVTHSSFSIAKISCRCYQSLKLFASVVVSEEFLDFYPLSTVSIFRKRQLEKLDKFGQCLADLLLLRAKAYWKLSLIVLLRDHLFTSKKFSGKRYLQVTYAGLYHPTIYKRFVPCQHHILSVLPQMRHTFVAFLLTVTSLHKLSILLTYLVVILS